jgi:hypothetical protein
MWLALFEVFWRSHAFVPTLTNSEALWCETRARAKGDAIAIVGSSRLQRGLDPEIISAELGGRKTLQLALDGGNPFPMLSDLARDPEFRGLVILEYMPKRWFVEDSPGTGRSESFIATCGKPSLVEGIEARMDHSLERRFVFLSPELQLIPLISYVTAHKALPRATRDILREDRFMESYFRSDQTAELGTWISILSAAELDRRFAEARASVDEIRARGGCVIAYRSPVSGEALQDEETHFPASVWFPRAARAIDAGALDFASVPELQAIRPPDGSHPDAAQAPLISHVFARQLRTMIDSVCPAR